MFYLRKLLDFTERQPHTSQKTINFKRLKFLKTLGVLFTTWNGWRSSWLSSPGQRIEKNLNEWDEDLSNKKKPDMVAESFNFEAVYFMKSKNYEEEIENLKRPKKTFEEIEHERKLSIILSNLANWEWLKKKTKHADSLA